MERNLDRRVEVLCPITDPALRKLLRDVVLEVLLERHRPRLAAAAPTAPTSGPRRPRAPPPVNSQRFLLDWYSSQPDS